MPLFIVMMLIAIGLTGIVYPIMWLITDYIESVRREQGIKEAREHYKYSIKPIEKKDILLQLCEKVVMEVER